jgi:hypothetical protein
MPEYSQGEIHVIVSSRMLASVSGHGINILKDLRAYANAINYDALEKYFEKEQGPKPAQPDGSR